MLNSVSQTKNVKISIYDINGNRLFFADRRKEQGVSNIDLKSFVVTQNDTILILEFTYPFSVKNFSEINAIKNILNVSLVLFLFVVLIIIIYLHHSLVKPLTELNQCFEKINPRAQSISNPLKRHDELGDLGFKLEEMSNRLNEANQIQSELIASISHDLKTPLTSIIGYLERIITDKVTSEDKRLEYEKIIHQKANHIKDIINEFNEFVINDPASTSLNLETISLHRFFDDLCLEYATELQIHKVHLKVTNEIPQDIMGALDSQKIRRVFANIVENALRYAEGLSEIKMSCHIDKNKAVFIIEDNGKGVPKHELNSIFNKFYRVDKSRSREKGGSGLGLAICRNIIENHRGTIGAYQAESGGLGIKFSLIIPTLNNS